MIAPTIGRVVWYRPSSSPTHPDHALTFESDQPMAAIVTYVWSDTCVNLAVFDYNGKSHSRTSVTLHQGEGECSSSPYCEWMPYQKGQAAKTEAAEEEARAAFIGSEVRRLGLTGDRRKPEAEDYGESVLGPRKGT